MITVNLTCTVQNNDTQEMPKEPRARLLTHWIASSLDGHLAWCSASHGNALARRFMLAPSRR
jgi:hypothetical protein